MGLRRKIMPAFTTPPTEVPPAVADEARIHEVDDKLRAIAVIPRAERAENLLWQENRLLDLRNAIRPAKPKPRPRVPYVPGGPVR